MRTLLTIFTLLCLNCFSQNFTYSGYIYNADGSPSVNFPVKVYKRTTPNLVGFTQQTNYDGHSYYRSTTTNIWTSSKTACESMGGHLATIQDAAENSFLFNTWPAGWIGYYQNKTSDYYTEPSGAWAWTEPEITRGRIADYDFASGRSYGGSGTVVNNMSGSVHADLYRSQTNGYGYSTLAGDFMFFNTGGAANPQGYMATRNLAPNFQVASKDLTLNIWILAYSNGVIVSERGEQSINSGWHDSNIEITGSNGTTGTLRLGLWNGASISQVSTTISMGTWNMVTLTYSGTTLRGYLNGIYFSQVSFNRQTPYSYGNGLHYFLAGSDFTNMGSGAFLDGRVGRFQVHNVALTDSEIKRQFMSMQSRFGRILYSNWAGGQPDDWYGEDYAQFVSGGAWNDLPNTYSYNYVLEFDYIIDYTPWVLETTVYTNTSGQYSISQPTNPSVERYIEISAVQPVTQLQNSDIVNSMNVIMGSTPRKSIHWNMYDVNNDNTISISDSYYIGARKNMRFLSWVAQGNSRLFTPQQYNSLISGTTNQKILFPGVPTITISSPVSGGSSNYYIIAPGYSSQVSY